MTLTMTKADTTIRKSLLLGADPATVWEHLTKADKLGTWFHPAKADLAEGQDYTLVSAKDGDRMCFGKVLEMRPHEYMKWDFSVGPLNGVMTTVEWQLEPFANGTRLTLTHSGLPDDDAGIGLTMMLDKGWHSHLAALYAEVAD